MSRQNGIAPRRRSPRTANKSTRRFRASETRQTRRGDDGSILVLALVFLIVTSLTVFAIATFAGNSLLQTTEFNTANALDYATGAAVQTEANYQRYLYQDTTTSLNTCMPTTTNGEEYVQFDNENVAVYCTIVNTPTSAATRVITYYSCPYTVSEADCYANPYLEAVVTFDDYSEDNVLSCDSVSDELTCGTGMAITSWDVT
jgi:hypothetical protein